MKKRIDFMKKNEKPVIIENSFNVSIERVWKAITDIDEMKLWYFGNIDSFKPEVGSKSRFAVQSGERIFTHLWEVTEVEDLRRITYNWKYKEHAGDSFVTFELSEIGLITNLKLTLNIVEDFNEEIPEFKRESCVGGWNYFINERLKEYLETSN